MRISKIIPATLLIATAFFLPRSLSLAEDPYQLPAEIAAADPSQLKDWDAYIQAGENNYELQTRAAEAIHAYDAYLQLLLDTFNAHLDEANRAQLLELQDNWTRLAKAEASFLSSRYAGGTHGGLVHALAYIQLQKDRVRRLNTLMIDYLSP